MSNIILRKPYGYQEEFLYPSGWRSFGSEIIGINTFEVINEVIGINKLYDGLIKEIIGISDLTSQFFVDIVGINNLDLAIEIISLNNLYASSEQEIISINTLATEFTPEIIVVNDLQSFLGPYTNEVYGVNRLGSGTFTEFSYSVSFFIDNVDVSKYVQDWRINMSGANYVNDFTVTFFDKNFFSQCDPFINLGTKRFRIRVDDLNYYFLMEKRSLKRDSTSGKFTVWGRSYICTLDLPYAIPITDKEVEQDSNGTWYSPSDASYVPNIWQTADRMASEIIDNVVGAGYTIDFQIDDFTVKRGSIVASSQSPISIVNSLVGIVGAYISTDILDKVIVKYFKFDEIGTVQATFTDIENILMLDEKLDFPTGYNKILVEGFAEEGETSFEIEIELDSTLNDDMTKFLFEEDIYFRIYRSPLDLEYTLSSSLGTITAISTSNSETITKELSGFTDQSMTLEKPIYSITAITDYTYEAVSPTYYSFTQGFKTVTSLNSSLKDEPVMVEYITQYDLYKINVARSEVTGTITDLDQVLSRILATATSE